MTRRDHIIHDVFGGLACWDARHFLHIAEFGYTWESTLAFFPLFPMLLRIMGGVIQLFIGQLSFHSAMLLGGAIFNNVGGDESSYKISFIRIS